MGLFDNFFKLKKKIVEETPLVAFTDPLFGRFLPIEDLCWFSGSISIQDKKVTVTLETKEGIEMLHHIYSNMEQLIEQSSRYAAKILLDCSNDWGYDVWVSEIINENNLSPMTAVEFDTWLNNNLPDKKYIPLRTEDFIKRMSLVGIHISKCSNYTLEYNDGYIFLGHHISIDGNMESGFSDARI